MNNLSIHTDCICIHSQFIAQKNCLMLGNHRTILKVPLFPLENQQILLPPAENFLPRL